MNYHENTERLLNSDDIFIWHEDADGDSLDPFYITGVYGKARINRGEEEIDDFVDTEFHLCPSWTGDEFVQELVSSIENYFNAPSEAEQIREMDDEFLKKSIYSAFGKPLDEIANRLRELKLPKLAQKLEAEKEKILDRLYADRRRIEILKATGIIEDRFDRRRSLVFSIMTLIEKFVPDMKADRQKIWFAGEILALFEIEPGGTDAENIDRIVKRLEQDAKGHPFKPSQWKYFDVVTVKKYLPDDLYRKLKVEAAMQKTSPEDLACKVLTHYLESHFKNFPS